MKARMCLVASALLFAAPAFAQEPLEKSGTEPSMQAAPPAGGPATTPEPLDKMGTQPSTDMSPGQSAATPEPMAKEGTAGQSGAMQPDAPATIVVTELKEVDDGAKIVKPWGLPADAVEELDVYDAAGKKIGEVDAVLQDKNGEIKGVAIGYGGFLGFGEKGAIVTLDQLQLKDGTLITTFGEDELASKPAWMDR